jgi:nucleoside-diphosphate-sugar epimerase
METVLVTGGAGFIGSWLCEDLVKNYHVVCVDNFITGKSDNVLHLLRNKNFTLLKHDVSRPLKHRGDIGYIFHLSSPASPVDYQKLPIETMLANSFGTYNMLNLAKEKGARFLLTSTSEVYGDPKEHPQREEYWGNVNPVGPRSCYDESKRFAEALAMSYHRKKNLDVRIARIFNTYGPRMRRDDGRVIPNFIGQALANKPLTVYGNGKQTRSFCYISDMVNGLKKVMFSGSPGEIFNLGNPEEFTVLGLANIVKRIAKSKSEIVFKELPKDDPVKRRPDITKARKRLGWSPEVGLEEGLKKTIGGFGQE